MEEEWRMCHLNQTNKQGVSVWGLPLIDEDTCERPRWYKIQVIRFVLEENGRKVGDAYKIGIAHCTDLDRQRHKYWAKEAFRKEEVIPILLAHTPEKQTRPPYPSHYDPVEEQASYMKLVEKITPLVDQLPF